MTTESRWDQEFFRTLDLAIRARYPLIYVVSAEEAPLEDLLRQLADHLQPKRTFLCWDVVFGWSDNGQGKSQLMAALNRIDTDNEAEPALFLLKDIHPVFRQPERPDNYPVIRFLKTLARKLRRTRKSVVFLSHQAVIPPELQEEIVVYDMPLPDTPHIQHLIQTLVRPEQLKVTGLALEQLVRACQGLTRQRIERILARALAAKQMITENDIDLVLEEKKQYIRQTGILEFYTPSETLKSVGGLENLKAWVRQRRLSFTDQARAYGLPNPKGVLLVGIQGTGKSLCAKTIAREWQMPLLRLDAGRLFGGIVGESKSRVRQMSQVAEAMAPCMLDEIDKALAAMPAPASGSSAR